MSRYASSLLFTITLLGLRIAIRYGDLRTGKIVTGLVSFQSYQPCGRGGIFGEFHTLITPKNSSASGRCQR